MTPMLLHDLDTPPLVCDLDVLERNIANMAAHCRDIGMPLRAHTKTHKIPEIAHKQIRAGAMGICCQKLGDAEVMVAAGISDVLIPYNIVGAKKVERLLRLVKRATMTVAVDSEDTARGIAEMAHADGVRVRVLVTVVSTPTPDRLIIDGGQKTFTSYPPKPYGHIIECPDAQIYAMSVEHGHVDVSRCSRSFRVGERLSVIPLHQEMTTNLHDELYGVRGEKVEVIWKVAGRGKVP